MAAINIELNNQIAEIMDSVSWIKQDLKYIYEVVKENNYTINCIINEARETKSVIELISQGKDVYNLIIDFCDSNITEEKVIEWFKYFTHECSLGILCYKLIEKYKDATWSRKINLKYDDSFNDLNVVFSMTKKYVTENLSSLVFAFDLKDADTNNKYCAVIVSDDSKITNLADSEIKFVTIDKQGNRQTKITRPIKLKDFNLNWLLNQNLI